MSTSVGRLRGCTQRRCCGSRWPCTSRRRGRPAEGNEVESGGEGGRGANPEVDFAAGNVHVVVALLALRKRMRSGSGGEGGRGANVEAEVVGFPASLRTPVGRGMSPAAVRDRTTRGASRVVRPGRVARASPPRWRCELVCEANNRKRRVCRRRGRSKTQIFLTVSRYIKAVLGSLSPLRVCEVAKWCRR